MIQTLEKPVTISRRLVHMIGAINIMKLDFTALNKAILSLSESISSTSDVDFMNSLTQAQQRTMKAGVIQHFEFTYELSWKMLRRQLMQEEGKETIDGLNRKDLYRLAAQKRILDDPENWFVFHRARNETSHTYDEKIAKDVYDVSLLFILAAEKLLKNLEVR